jgi:crossover junction endodeoxyribonuclease RuvC
VLGLDPGTRATGWGVVERDGSLLKLVACGTLRPPASATPAERLAFIYEGLTEVMASQEPDAVGVEEAFAGRNMRSAIRLGEARAICLLVAAQAGRPVHELPPALIKKAVTGHGRSGKEGVRRAVQQILRWPADQAPPSYDAADALAGAICTMQRSQIPAGLVPGGGLGRRRRKRNKRWSAADVARIQAEAWKDERD